MIQIGASNYPSYFLQLYFIKNFSKNQLIKGKDGVKAKY